VVCGENDTFDENQRGEDSGPAETAELRYDGQCHDASDEEEPDGGVKEFDPN
jgi:hypothetical protein